MGWNPSKEDIDVVSTIISELGLEDFILRNFNEMSGGERQKVLVARAMAQEPKILLLDEPTSALDIKHQLDVLKLVKRTANNKKILALMAIHDLSLASQYSDEIVLMKLGQVFARGSPEKVINQENIKTVYDVDTRISWRNGRPCPIPVVDEFRDAEILFAEENESLQGVYKIHQHVKS